MIRAFALTALTLLLTPSVYATERFSDRASAEACAREFQSQSGENTYEVVNILSHPGPGSFSIWMNSERDGFAGFCVTSSGRVISTYVRDAHWIEGEYYRPENQELAAR